MHSRFTSWKFLLALLFVSATATSQNIGDYRSVVGVTMDWNNNANWETWDGDSWEPAGDFPDFNDGVITITSGDSMRLGFNHTIDQVVVEQGAGFVVFATITVNDGPGDDIVVDGGFFVSTSSAILTGAGNVIINDVIDVGGNHWRYGFMSVRNNGFLRVPTTIDGELLFTATANIGNSILTNNGRIIWMDSNVFLETAGSGGDLVNNGILDVRAGANVLLGGNTPASYTQSSTGVINLANAINFTFSTPSTLDGYLAGHGQFLDNDGTRITANSSQLRPGDYDTDFFTQTIGILSADDDLADGMTPEIWIEVLDGNGAGLGHDQVNFNAVVDLSGVDLIVTEDDAAPLQQYVIMTAPGPNGFQNNFNSTNIPLGYTITIDNASNPSTVIVEKIAITLPAVWGNFNAIARDGEVRLSWSTLQENNTSHFVVEHSTDGRNFTAIGNVSAAGYSSDEVHYNFTHATPQQGKNNIYRLQQVDLDGKQAYSVIRTVSFKNGKPVAVQVAPNPVRDIMNITIQEEQIRVSLADANGRTLRQWNLQPGTHTISTADLPTGVYNLVITQNGEYLETKRIVKQ